MGDNNSLVKIPAFCLINKEKDCAWYYNDGKEDKSKSETEASVHKQLIYKKDKNKAFASKNGAIYFSMGNIENRVIYPNIHG